LFTTTLLVTVLSWSCGLIASTSCCLASYAPHFASCITLAVSFSVLTSPISLTSGAHVNIVSNLYNKT
jgi:hypothetical protein